MPTRNRGTRSIRFSAVVGIRSTVSRYMVWVVQSYEQATALCMPPSLAHRKMQVGGRAAWNMVNSIL